MVEIIKCLSMYLVKISNSINETHDLWDDENLLPDSVSHSTQNF